MLVACVHIPRFAIEVERQRRNDVATRLILIGDATVFDCSLGAEASGVQRGMRMSEAIGLCHRAVVLPPDLPHYQRRFDEVLDFLEATARRDFDSPAAFGGSGQVWAPPISRWTAFRWSRSPSPMSLIASLHRRLGFMAAVGTRRRQVHGAGGRPDDSARPGEDRAAGPGGGLPGALARRPPACR